MKLLVNLFNLVLLTFILSTSVSQLYAIDKTNNHHIEYKVSDYGIVPNDKLVQTEAIQNIVDMVNEKGGGVIVFSPGTYVTGTIELKSNVGLYLDKKAIILGSTNPLDYKRFSGSSIENININSDLALMIAVDAENISLNGKGTIDGRGLQLALNVDSLHHKGIMIDPKYDRPKNRPNEAYRPKLFRIVASKNINFNDVTLRNSACWGVAFELCRNVNVKNVTLFNRAFWNNDGFDITDCHNVHISDCNINSADDGVCLKSDYPGYTNDSIFVNNCTIRSSASAIKFGTASRGGFKNVFIDNIKVYDTYRSAIALENVDGGVLENIRITNIYARNTGNAIFVRLGHRAGEKPGILKNIYIGKVKVEIPFGRPDEDYDMRGPDVEVFHNPIPSSITGLLDAPIENITLEDIEILYPGRGTKGMAYVPLWRLDAVPEAVKDYPEFTMFGELPAWGFYVRHVEGISFKNVRIGLKKDDYRPAFVLDDVDNISLDKIDLPKNNKQIVIHEVGTIKGAEGYDIQKY